MLHVSRHPHATTHMHAIHIHRRHRPSSGWAYAKYVRIRISHRATFTLHGCAWRVRRFSRWTTVIYDINITLVSLCCISLCIPGSSLTLPSSVLASSVSSSMSASTSSTAPISVQSTCDPVYHVWYMLLRLMRVSQALCVCNMRVVWCGSYRYLSIWTSHFIISVTRGVTVSYANTNAVLFEHGNKSALVATLLQLL